MKIPNIMIGAYHRCRLGGAFVFTLLILLGSPTLGMAQQVGLYDVWETQVTNSKNYSNPFDFNVIELQATFTSPSGGQTNFFGFYDGNGQGGQNGNVWKLRFMPDKVGTWSYTYRWTDGTSGGSGSFNVVDTGLPGPLKVATDNPWYFMDARGNPFHFRGYDAHHFQLFAPNASIIANRSWYENMLQSQVINAGYNFTMLESPTDRLHQFVSAHTSVDTWWVEGQTKQFKIATWKAWEGILNRLKGNKVYTIDFVTFVFQGGRYNLTDMRVLERYFLARFASYYNYFGWSPTWEWSDIWSESNVNTIMNFLNNNDPFSRLQTIHDSMRSSFQSWGGFSMRQRQSRTVFQGNGRQYGGVAGNLASAFVNRPIIGSEDIWEIPAGTWGQPRNGTEVRRGAWGLMMAGVMPLYNDWNQWAPNLRGNGQGEPHVKRMFDFFYSKTKYREYTQLNHLVSSSARQIASGKAGQEYLVYDENGGSITINLSSAAASNTFNVLWYNPASGATQNGSNVNGGGSRTLNSPFSGDTVLLLTNGGADNSAPKPPTGLKLDRVN